MRGIYIETNLYLQAEDSYAILDADSSNNPSRWRYLYRRSSQSPICLKRPWANTPPLSDQGDDRICNLKTLCDAIVPIKVRGQRRAAWPIGGDDEVVDLLRAEGEAFEAKNRELLSLRGVVDGAERFVVQHLDDRHGVPVRVVDGVVVGEADVLVPEVGVRAGDGRGGVDAVESPRPSRRSALSVSDDDLDRVGAEGQFADVDRDRVFEISRRGERLRRSPINRLRRRRGRRRSRRRRRCTRS